MGMKVIIFLVILICVEFLAIVYLFYRESMRVAAEKNRKYERIENSIKKMSEKREELRCAQTKSSGLVGGHSNLQMDGANISEKGKWISIPDSQSPFADISSYDPGESEKTCVVIKRGETIVDSWISSDASSSDSGSCSSGD